jgi:hypothetical protein
MKITYSKGETTMSARFLVFDLHEWIKETSKTHETNDVVKVCNELKSQLKKIQEANKNELHRKKQREID